MHHAWRIDDLTHLVFERLEREDLVRLAQTCNFLFKVVTERLWRKITSAIPFIHCLSNNYRTRPIGIKEVERLDYYSSKVRELVFSLGYQSHVVPREYRQKSQKKKKKKRQMKPGEEIEDNNLPKKTWEQVWLEIATLRSDPATFLPNLEKLRVDCASEAMLLPLIRMPGSNLKYLQIQFLDPYPEYPGTAQKLFDGLRNTSKLEHLFVCDGGDTVPSSVIEKSPLKELRLNPKVSKSRTGFPKLPLRLEILEKSELQDLVLGITRDWHTRDLNTSMAKYLPALQTLCLDLSRFDPAKCEGTGTGRCLNAGPNSWTCTSTDTGSNENEASDCGRRSPALLLKSLNRPAPTFLNFKFPESTTGPMFLEMIEAMKNGCRLQGMTKLFLSGGSWCHGSCTTSGWHRHTHPRLEPRYFLQAVQMLLPMPRLKILSLSVATNFLDSLDLNLFQSLAAGLPALEYLTIGPYRPNGWDTRMVYEKFILHHIAALCSYMSNLRSLSIGSIDVTVLEGQPSGQWVSSKVTKLSIMYFIGKDYEKKSQQADIDQRIRAYWPNSNLAERGIVLWPQC